MDQTPNELMCDHSGAEEYERLANRVEAMRRSIPWDIRNAGTIHELMVEMGKLVDLYRSRNCFS